MEKLDTLTGRGDTQGSVICPKWNWSNTPAKLEWVDKLHFRQLNAALPDYRSVSSRLLLNHFQVGFYFLRMGERGIF